MGKLTDRQNGHSRLTALLTKLPVTPPPPFLFPLQQVNSLMGFLTEVNQENSALKNQLAEKEHDQAAELELERSRIVSLTRRLEEEQNDRKTARKQVSGKKRLQCAFEEHVQHLVLP